MEAADRAEDPTDASRREEDLKGASLWVGLMVERADRCREKEDLLVGRGAKGGRHSEMDLTDEKDDLRHGLDAEDAKAHPPVWA